MFLLKGTPPNLGVQTVLNSSASRPSQPLALLRQDYSLWYQEVGSSMHRTAVVLDAFHGSWAGSIRNT
jgi:hypothetical protein